MNVVELDHVWERYRIKFIEGQKVSWEEVWALRDISFALKTNESLGVIGLNGAGKTTLLKVIAGMLLADRGTVTVRGRVSALMELGAGFNPEFTGRENIELNAGLYGFPRNEVRERMGEIIEFAGLRRFIDAPLKYYSQGMYMRLAFSLAIFVEPDILLIDDIFAVGDKEAQEKCIKKIFELKRNGKAIVLVSHDMNMIAKLCDRVILLEEGRAVCQESPRDACERYLRAVRDRIFIASSTLSQADRSHTLTGGDFSCSLDCGLKTVRLYYKGREITRAAGFSTSLKAQCGVFCSSDGLWFVREVSPQSITLAVDYDFPGLRQIYIFSCNPGTNSISIRIDIETSGIASFYSHETLLELSSDYSRWSTEYERGSLATERYIDDTGPVRMRQNNPKTMTLVPSDPGLPRLLIQELFLPEQRFVKLYKRRLGLGEYAGYGSLFVSVPQEDKTLEGRQTVFEGNISAGTRNILKRKAVKQKKLSLVKGALEFIFEPGRGRVRYGGQELTSGMCLYTSICSLGVWHDSRNAVWRCQDQTKQKIVVQGWWAHLPVYQLWEIECVSDSCFTWRIMLGVREKISLEIEQTHAMVSCAYERWRTEVGQQGEFLDEYSRLYDISHFRFWYGKTSALEAFSSRLPNITFRNETCDSGMRAAIENSDDLYKARVLQYQKTNHAIVIPGEHLYFKGMFNIGKIIDVPKV